MMRTHRFKKGDLVDIDFGEWKTRYRVVFVDLEVGDGYFCISNHEEDNTESPPIGYEMGTWVILDRNAKKVRRGKCSGCKNSCDMNGGCPFYQKE